MILFRNILTNLKTVLGLLMFIFLFGCSPSKNNIDPGPKVHFTLDHGSGSPMELLYYKDNYHLFYTYKTESKNINWGKAQSPDLIHWQKQPLSIEPDTSLSMGMGSIVTDWNNTSGFSETNPPLVAIYTTYKEGQLQGDQQKGRLSLSYSIDNGKNWKKYSGTPIVLDNYFDRIRDLKIIWNEENQKWIMLVLSGYQVRFYSSDNLIDWEYQSVFGDQVYKKIGDWTSVDFFPIETENSNEMKWILFISDDAGSPNEGSGIQYFIGDFDGYVYKSTHTKPKWVDNGSDVYKGIVLSDYMTVNKPISFIADISNTIYKKFNIHPEPSGVFTLARQLKLKQKDDDYYLVSEPVKALESIEKGKQFIKGTQFSGQLKIKKDLKLPMEIDLTFDVNNRLYLDMAEDFGIRLTNKSGEELMMGYHSQRRYFFITEPKIREKFPDTWDGFNYASYVLNEPTMDLKIIIDRTSVELFAMNGLVSLTRKFVFDDNWDQLSLFAEKGKVTLKEGSVTELQRIQ